MRIGILTYHRAYNYGAVLQCYGLKTFLESQGHIVSIIDYWPDYHADTYKILNGFRTKSTLSKIKSLIILLIGIRRIRKRNNGYKQFIYNYLNINKKISHKTIDSVKSLVFDIVVYGSDQIWRKSFVNGVFSYESIYWGELPKKVMRKISYAASMGIINDINENDTKFIKRMLLNFDAISVRECDLLKLLSDQFNVNAKLVLDPVFLIDKIEWLQLCVKASKKSEIKEKYILFYHLVHSEESMAFVNNLAKRNGYRIIEIRGKVNPIKIGTQYYQTLNPIDFLELIKNAEIVVSTSFHGIAFSIIFEKQFYAIGMGTNSGRAKSLLNILNIHNRYIETDYKQFFFDNIDYSKIFPKLMTLKEESIAYLNSNIR